jgi:zinc protease
MYPVIPRITRGRNTTFLFDGDVTLIDSAKLKPFDPVYIEKVRETQRRGYEVNLKQNRFWLNSLHSFYEDNGNPEKMLNYPKFVKKLSAPAIQNAVKKYFNMENYVKVVLYPEKK